MREDLKERIELIKCGKVPEGYKKTKLGIIPIDWEIVRVQDILEKVDKPVEVESEEEYTQIGIKSHGKGIFYKEAVTGKELGNKRVFWVEPDCLIVNIVFAWERAVAKTTQKEKGMIASHRFPMFKAVDNKVSIDYLFYYFMSKKGKELMEEASPGGAGRNRTLGLGRFLKSYMVLPNIKQQSEINEIMNLFEKKIKITEKLLECKRKQFDVLVNRFLGVERTNNFLMGEIGECYSGLSGKEKGDFGIGEPYITYKNVYNNYIINETLFEFVKIDTIENQNIVETGDVLFTISSETVEDAGMASVYLGNEKKVYLNSFCFGYRIKNKEILLPEYAVFYFRSPIFRKHIKILAQGVTRYNIVPRNLMNIVLSIPSIEEQKFVVDILLTAIKEIELIERKVNLLEDEKKAMNQILIRGIVRR